MKKIVLFLLIILSVGILSFIIFMANFKILDESKEVIINSKKDLGNTRTAILAKSEGNATLNESLNLYISNINNLEEHKELIFLMSSGYTNEKDIEFYWKNSDTLVIEYNKNYDVFTKEFKTITINPVVKIEYKAK